MPSRACCLPASAYQVGAKHAAKAEMQAAMLHGMLPSQSLVNHGPFQAQQTPCLLSLRQGWPSRLAESMRITCRTSTLCQPCLRLSNL